MADTNIVGSLFGVTPEAIQMQRDLVQQKQAMDFANLTPQQQSQYGMFRGGQQLGGAAAGFLGIEDPQLKMVRTAQELAKQFDITTPKGLQDYASALQSAGLNQFASMAFDRANQLTSTALEQGVKRADIYHKTAEAIKQVGLTPAGLQVYQQGTQQFTLGPGGTMIEYTGPVQSKTPITSVTVTGEKAFSSKLGTLDAERVAAANTAADNSRIALKTLSQLESQQDVISGTGAAARVSGANFLNTLGLINAKDVARLSSSEQYQKLAKDLVMQDLGGKLGAQISDADRAYVEARIPQLETSPQARKELINYLKNKHKDVITEAKDMDTYARKHNGLGDYEPKTILTPSMSPAVKSQLDAIDTRLKALGINPDGTPIKK